MCATVIWVDWAKNSWYSLVDNTQAKPETACFLCYEIVQATGININLALDIDITPLESGNQLSSNIYEASHQGPLLIFLTMENIDFTEFSDSSIPHLSLCSLPD